MTWLMFAFSAPVLWAASTHIDKYLVERFLKHSGIAVLMVFTALIGLVPLPVIAAFQPGIGSVPLASIAVISISGVLYMAGMFFYLQALQSEEASVVAPFYQATPLFGYVLAYLVLGETLSPRQMGGGLLILGGTLLVSLGPSSVKARFKLRLVVLMLSCALVLAVSTTIFKMFAVEEEFWTTVFWTFVGESAFGAVLLAIPACGRQFALSLKANTGAMLTINGANELINLGGGLGSRYALLLAPLSLVQAIGSTTTLFVFLFGIVLTIFLPRLGREDLSPRNLTQKGVSAVLVALGVILVSR
jgi:uncharacterized membrane protein